jgi:1-acyl-sn-glycerol-3-phosphate acyltransferase
LLTPLGQLVLLLVLAVIATAAAWYILILPTLELVLEFMIWPFSRIRARGPGKFHIPQEGPLLVIANHTAWFDPLWMCKIAPRPLTPMMTSEFYDLPVINFFMRVFSVIRVQSSSFRREAPELDDAIARLDQGGCVLIFPEGWMKRKEATMLRQFGQGIWHILRRRPQTPVVCAWIDGGWGSWASYAGGPPTRNKPIDILRRIQIGVQEPVVVPPEILADHRQTRAFLHRRVLEARQYVGLDVPELPAESEEEEKEEPADQAG